MNFGKVKLGAALLAAATASLAPAAVIQSGVYRLHNHPNGDVNPPPYGARFDELFNATSGSDFFTLNFDDPSSAVFMNVDLNAGTITISGTATGGRDVGNSYANDQYLGLYTLSFTYSLGVQAVPGDDDVWVNTANHANVGKITAPNGGDVNLVDERDNGFSFRFGDEDNDLGHRSYNGLSGWGWMSYKVGQNITHVAATDWLFTATLTPEPAAVATVVGGLLACALLGRRR